MSKSNDSLLFVVKPAINYFIIVFIQSACINKNKTVNKAYIFQYLFERISCF